MDYEESQFSLNRYERTLTTVLLAGGWVLILLAVAAVGFRSTFQPGAFTGGMRVAATALTGVVLLLASAGVRQNRIAVELGFFLTFVTGFSWLWRGVFSTRTVPLIVGLVMLVLFALMLYLRHRAVAERFSPVFFSRRQFETMIQIADTIIETDGEAVLHPIEVAINIDRLIGSIEADVKRDIKRGLIITEWILPLLTFRPFPFSNLGSNARRAVLTRVIGARGLFRDIARMMKMLACSGYYGSEKGMAQVGYRPIEERSRFETIDLTPIHHQDPH